MKKRLMALLMCAALLLTASCALADVDCEKAYGAYEQEVTLTVAKPVVASPSFGNPDDNQGNNTMTRLIHDRLNIKIDLVWESDDYANKLAMQIIADDLPDMFSIPAENYLLYRQLVDNGKLYDLSKLIPEYSGDYLNYIFESYNNRTLDAYTEEDGAIYCIAAGNYDYDGHSLLWLRKDWLDALKLDIPKTVEELEKVLIAFRDNYGSIGLLLSPDSPLGGYGTDYSASPLACALNAYPGTWVKGEDGKLVYGSLDQGMKGALSTLAKWYQEGLIDQEFATRTQSSLAALFTSGQTGAAFGKWSLCFNISEFANVEGAELIAVKCPLNEDGTYNVLGPSALGNMLCVNAKCKNPEAVLKVMNLEFEAWRGVDKAGYEATNPDRNSRWVALFPTGGVNMEKADALLSSYRAAKEKVETGTIADESIYTQQELTNANKSYNYSSGADRSAPMWIQYHGRYVAPQTFENLNIMYPAFSFTTESMADFWPNLKALEQTAFLSIIVGDKPVDYFDTFVSEWYAQGGELVMEEVNQAAR